MIRELVLETLRAHERRLKEAGILRLSLFGSTARGEAGPSSDIDLLAAFDESRRLSVLDVAGLALRPTDRLGTRVDLSEDGCLQSRVQRSVEAEACVPSKDPIQRRGICCGLRNLRGAGSGSAASGCYRDA